MRIIVCGLNGAGKSTLGRALAGQLHYEFRDIEDYFFPKTDDKYEYRVQIEKLFDMAVYIDIPKEIRMARVRKRSNDKFGNRMLPGGDLYESEERFFKMVEARSDDHAKGWLTDLTCPVISIDGTVEVATNVETLLNVISSYN